MCMFDLVIEVQPDLFYGDLELYAQWRNRRGERCIHLERFSGPRAGPPHSAGSVADACSASIDVLAASQGDCGGACVGYDG